MNTNIINHPTLANTDEALKALELSIWQFGRDNLITAIELRLVPLADIWAIYQRLMGAWQRRHGVMFVALADCNREAIVDHLKSIED